MPSFGEKLKLEREKRDITLDQVSSSTKIGKRMLQALEEDRFSQLPGGIFNKGFVRAYARVVGLDEDQVVADYLEASGDAPTVMPDTVGHDHVRDGEQAIRIREREDDSGRLGIRAEAPSRQLPWGAFAVTLLLVALALSLWTHRRREQEQSQRRLHEKVLVQPSAVPPAEQPVSESAGNAPASESRVAPSPTSGSTIPSPPTSAQTNFAASSTRTATSNPKSPLPAQSSQSAPTATPAAASTLARGSIPAAVSTPSPGEFTLVIQAHQESWLSITADGKFVGSASLAPGDTRTIHGRKQVFVKTGNVGGLDFLLNGKKLDITGQSGEVKTLAFGPTGLLPEAPTPPTPQP